MLCDTCRSPKFCITVDRCELLNSTQSALDKQISGNHYKDKAIQPIIYIHANNLGFCEGNVVKYITRWREKNGIADLEKAKHYIELLIEMENAPK
jgi:hypothetical protein